jgi:hypothetical protein
LEHPALDQHEGVMHQHGRWLAVTVACGLVALGSLNLRRSRADDPKRMTAEDVIALWTPRLEGTEDFQQFSASPKESPGLAASTFRVVGPSFERLWNHYADRCGIADRYEASRGLVDGGRSAKGSYVVSDRISGDAQAKRMLTVFVLRTDHSTVTVTIQPDPDGKAVYGSITALTP